MKNKVLSETKFKYQHLENKLSKIDPNNPEYSYVIPAERTFTTQFGGRVFVLEPDFPQHWINFTVKSNQITVFYKTVLNDGEIIYYRRNFAKSDIISFEFSDQDRVEKINGHWRKKEPD